MQYSIDGEHYTDIAAYAVEDNKVMEQAFDVVALPEEAENREALYIRIAVASEELIGGATGLVGTTGGETAINDVVVNGFAGKNAAVQENTTVANDANSSDVSSASSVAVLPLLGLLIGGGVLVASAIVIVVAIVMKKKTT